MIWFAVFNYRLEHRGFVQAKSAAEALRMVPQYYPFVFGAMVEPVKENED
jgi:hypothetical protein